MASRKSSNLLEVIESSWGEKFDESLADTISRAPGPRLASFIEECSRYIHLSRPAKLGPGELRPEVRETYGRTLRGRSDATPTNIALNLLLFTNSAVLQDPFDVGFLSVDSAEEVRRAIALELRNLALMAPLIRTGVITFAPLSRTRHPSYAASSTLIDPAVTAQRRAAELAEQLARTASVPVDDVLYYLLQDVAGSLNLARNWAGTLTPLMHGAAELEVLRSVLLVPESASRLDGRTDTLSKLSSFSLPSLRGAGRDLVAIRQSDEVFAEWRAAVQSALANVADLPDRDELWQRHASEILLDGMSGIRASAEAQLKKSRFLRSSFSGFQSFAFAGIGAVAGASMTGLSPVGGIVGAGVSKGLEFGGNYLTALRERRGSRAVMEVILAVEAGAGPQ